MVKPISAGRDEAVAGSGERTPSVWRALASLSLSMLLSSLGTSIANVGLPTLAQAFTASFQQVQWIVLAYLLAITTLIVSVGRLGDCYFPDWRAAIDQDSGAAARDRSGLAA